MKTHHLLIYNKSLIESNNVTIDNLLKILYNFGYIEDTSIFDNTDKKYLFVQPSIQINEHDPEFLSDIKTYSKKDYNITMKYMDTEEIIITAKKIHLDNKYTYIPTIHNVIVTLNNKIVELKFKLKYVLKQAIN